MRLEPGARLGVYEIRAFIGAGGMGEVYRARDARLGREVAVKVLPDHLVGDPEARARFEAEARAVAALSHPGIVTLFDVGETGGVTFTVCELLEGDSLRQRLRGGPLPVAHVIDIGAQLADALGAAHSKGVVHRDVKPDNVFLTRDGRARILDFGLARLSPAPLEGVWDRTTATILTRAGAVLGTLPYMSPEQAQGQPVDARSDIFSLGATLFECATGRRAFAGASAADVVTAVLRDEPADVSRLRPDAPRGLGALIRRSLEKDRDRRFQSARDLAFALRSLSEEKESGSGPARPRNRAGALAAAAALLALGVGIGWLALGRTRDSPQGPSFATMTSLTGGHDYSFAPALSPDGKWIAYVQKAGERADVWVRFLSGGDPVNLTGSSGLLVQGQDVIGGLDISPDGSQIAFNAAPPGDARTTLLAWTIPAPLGGTPRRLLQRGQAARWSPDGTKLTYVLAGGPRGDGLAVANADGSEERVIVIPRQGLHVHWPAWSHDGRHVYFIQGVNLNREPSEIYRVPVEGGEPDAVVGTSRRALFPAPLADGSGLVYAANPDSPDLGLFFRPSDGGPARRLTLGAGEYATPRASARGDVLAAVHVRPRVGLAELVGGAWVRLTAGATGDLDPAMSWDGTKLVFSSTRAGSRNLWIAEGDGSRARPLTTGPAIDDRPAFSPDGKSVAFVSDRGGRRGIWLVPSEGGAPRLVAQAVALDQLTFSRDGADVYFAAPGGDAPGIFRASVATGAVTRFPTPGGAFAPAFSPVADEIAYIELRAPHGSDSRSNLRIVDIHGNPRHLQLDQEANLANGRLAWSRDGRRIATLRVPGAAENAIYVFDVATGAATRLPPLPIASTPRGVCFTADGQGVMTGLYEATSEVVLLR